MQSTNNLIDFIKEYPDPRYQKGVRYNFSDLLLIIIYAVLSGFGTGVEIAEYAEYYEEYFKKLINIKKAPSHDTFSRIIRMINFDYLSSILSRWLAANYPELFEKYGGLKVLHFDGKAIKAAALKSEGERPIYLFNAMYEGQTISLTTMKIGSKENEQGKAIEFLKIFDLENTIITADAAMTTEPIINYIEDKNGYYLLPVKDNQKRLKESIDNYVKKLELKDQEGKSLFDNLDSSSIISKEHGRIETTTLTLIKNMEFIYNEFQLKGLYKTIARICVYDKKTIYKENGEEKELFNRTYLITNCPSLNASNLLSIKKSHWNIEMQHWILDVQLNEDRCTSRKDNSVVNNSILKRFVMKLKKQNSEYDGMSMKLFQSYNFKNIDNLTKMLFGKVYE